METNQRSCSKADVMFFIDLAGTDTVHERGHAGMAICDRGIKCNPTCQS